MSIPHVYTMKKILVLFAIIIIPVNYLSAKANIDSLLHVLDNKIANNDSYIELKNSRIEDLYTEKNKVNNSPSKIYDLNLSLYREYRFYISDSAIHYLNLNLDIAHYLKDQYKINEISIAMAYMFSRLGMYKEAIDMMNDIKKDYFDKAQRIDYYSAYKFIYVGLRLYTQNQRDKEKFRLISVAYEDTILSLADKTSEEYLRIKETRLREEGKIDEALRLNDERLKLTKMGTSGYALVAYHRSLLYKLKDDHLTEKEYLILSAISDIQSAVKDNASISVIANILMNEGDINRAHRYVRFSLNNINDYNTRIRSSEILNIQSIIDRAYQEKNEEQKKTLRIFLIATSILSILLIVSVGYVYKQMRKGIKTGKQLKDINLELNILNEKLHTMNNDLRKINAEVTEANQIKEEYIGYFLGECLKYIDKLDGYRKMVNRKIQDKQIESLYKQTRNNELKEEELKELFVNFDTMFLHLFPDFVEKFNSLLLDDEQISLKKGEVLNTELRIYALMRLGINDNNKIASFLGYSVNTIYNYRAKIKNKARISREDFEPAVRKIGIYRK